MRPHVGQPVPPFQARSDQGEGLSPDGDGAVARAFGLGGLGARVEARGHAGAVLEVLRLKVGGARA